MILVMEAGYHGCVAFSAASTLPVSASTRIRASALTAGAEHIMAAHAAAKTKPVVHGREIIQIRGPTAVRGPTNGEGAVRPPATPPDARATSCLLHRRRAKKQNQASHWSQRKLGSPTFPKQPI